MRFVFCALLFLLLNYSCSSEHKEQFDILIQDGNVIDLETGDLHKQDIFISNGRIKKISSDYNKLNTEAKQTIDARGKFLLPGFWDNHAHFRGGDSLIDANKNFLNLYIANGITTVRDTGGDLTSSIMHWQEQIAAGKLIGPTIFTSGPKIDGPNGTWAGSLVVESESDINKALDSLQAIPTDFVKLYDSQITGEAYLKTIAEAENRNLITSGHMPFTVLLDDAIGSGIDAIEHLYYIMKGCSSDEKAITQQLIAKHIGFWDAMPALMSTYQDSTAQATFTNLKENNVYVVTTLHIGKVLSYLDEVDHGQDDYLKYISPNLKKTYIGRIQSALSATEKARQDRKDVDAFFGLLSKALNDAGVGLLAGSDSGAYNSYVYPGISLHKELEEMVANGIPPLDALRTSAFNGSKFLKREEEYGSIAVGKVSDLVILDANPLEKIEHTQKIHTVIKGNDIYTKELLKALLEAVIQN